MYSPLDARSTVRVSLARDLLTRPACGRPTRCEDAAPKSPETHQFTRTEPLPAGVRETMRPRARVAERPGARGMNANERAPLSRRRIQFAGERERELASQRPPSREEPPPATRAGPHDLSLSVALSPLSVDRRRGAPSSSSKRSARVQLCWHITQRGGGGDGRGNIQRITFAGARPAAGRWPRGAVGPGTGHGGLPGPRGRRGPFGGAAAFLGKVRHRRSHAATCTAGRRLSVSPRCTETPFLNPKS